MEVHLVDATYELFRAHFSPRPPVLGREGLVMSGVSGLVEQVAQLLDEAADAAQDHALATEDRRPGREVGPEQLVGGVDEMELHVSRPPSQSPPGA